MRLIRQSLRDDTLVHRRAFRPQAPSSSKYRLAALAYTLIRFAIGAVFVWSGAIKLLDHRNFAVIIESYGLIPEATVVPTAIVLSLLELLAGLGLIWDLQGTLSVITGLLLLFMAILGYGLWMGLDVDCGCFGPEDPEAEAYHGLRPALYRDMVMMAGIGYLFLWRRIGSIRPRSISELNFLKPKGDEADETKGHVGTGIFSDNGNG